MAMDGRTKNWNTNSSITVPFVRPRVIVRHVLAAELREPPLDIWTDRFKAKGERTMSRIERSTMSTDAKGFAPEDSKQAGRRAARTAEADAGAVAVVDAEEVRVVRPAAAAQEIHHVDPPHLAGGSLFSRPVRVHDAALLLVGIAVDDGGDSERDNPREQGDTTKIKAACDPAPAPDLPYLNRPRQGAIKRADSYSQEGRAGEEGGRRAKIHGRIDGGAGHASPRVAQNVGVGLEGSGRIMEKSARGEGPPCSSCRPPRPPGVGLGIHRGVDYNTTPVIVFGWG
jgi:hypothetical protein